MVSPENQDLYIIQNEFGLIKIGRSINVYERIRELQKRDRCKVTLVEAFPFWGHCEERLHIRLSKYRAFGEWFSGDDATRDAIVAIIRKKIVWPISYKMTEGKKWVDHMVIVRKYRAARRAIDRLSNTLGSMCEPDRFMDGQIFAILSFLWIKEDGRLARVGASDFCYSYESICGRYQHQVLIPAFTQNIAAALSLWPESNRPLEWDGTAVDCCAQAVRAQKIVLTDPPRLALIGQSPPQPLP